MIRNFIVLALSLLLTVQLSAQQKSKLPVQKNQLSIGFRADKTSHQLKSMSTFRQKMDSLDVQLYFGATEGWITTDNEKFTYDSKGRLILSIIHTNYTLDGNFTWYKDTASYFADGKPTLQERFTRNLETAPWVFTEKTETYYNLNGQDTMSLYTRPDSLTGKMVIVKHLNTWNAGLLTSSLTYLWNETTVVWAQTGKSESVYDLNHRLISQTTYHFSEADQKWIGDLKEEFTYDNQGNETLYTNFSWNSATSGWNLQHQITRTFNSGNLLLEEIYSNRNLNLNQWIPDSMGVFYYDANGYDTLDVGSRYNPIAGTWNETYRMELTFDEFGNLWHSQALSDKDSTGTWTYRYKADYRFNLAFDLNEIAMPFMWVGKVPAHMYLGAMAWEWNNPSREWVESMKLGYYYSEFKGSSTDPVTQQFAVHVYPNPVTNVVIVETDQSSDPLLFRMTDVTGKQVVSKTLSSTRIQISMRDLPVGLYLYRIIRNGESYQGKIVKR